MSWLKKYFFVFILLVSFINVPAQYRFDSWTTDNGLPQNSVRTILQTSDGYIWLTTLDGLVRFDGVRFKVFNKSNSKTLPSNRFINLFAEADDTLWIGTEEQGVARYQNGEFRVFTTADGLPSNILLGMVKTVDDSLMAFTLEGAARFDGARFMPELNEREMRTFKSLSAASGRFWQIDKNRLSLTENGRQIFYDLPPNLKKEFDSLTNFILTVNLFESARGNLWIAANNAQKDYAAGKLFKFSEGGFEEITAENMPPSLVLNMEQDRHGDLWLATQKDGACRLSENRFACYTPENGLPSRHIRDVFRDREETLWIATEDKGFYRLTEQAIASISGAQGLAEKNAYTIYEDRRGAIWIGSYGGLAEYKNGEFTNYGYRDGLIYVDVQSLFEDSRGRLWIGSLDGVEYLENGKFYDFKKSLGLSNQVFGVSDIHEDRSGNLWFASSVGLIRYDGEKAETLTTENGLPGNNVKAIVENADDSLWIATYDGIALWKDGKFNAYTEKDGLAGNHVRALYADETGALWIGTYDSGLSRFKDGKFVNYTTENGLSSNGVFQILEDADKNFWMSSNQGIYRVSRAQLEELARGERKTVTSTLFGKTDGMLSTEANGGGQPAGTKTSDGRLWFPTQDGAAIVNPEAVRINPLPPPVVIENARIDNENLANFRQGIEMMPGQENLEIDYAGLSFIKPEQLNFRYTLEGFDDDWTEAGNRRTAFYPHLAPGEYTFRVIAANSDNVWNEQGAALKITVKPHFYQTRLFILASIAAVLVLVYAVYRRRVRQFERARLAQEEFSRRLMQAHEDERRRVAAELHDSIGQTLAMIKNRAVFNSLNTHEIEAAREQFDQITEQSAAAITEVREISYNLRPYLLERFGLTKALKSLFNKTAESSRLEFETEIDDLDGLFGAEEEMSVYRIVQESLNNILKHAEASRVEIKIKKSENQVSIKIRDDGKGFAASGEEKKAGFGLFGIAERVRILGGTYRVESVPGKGTKINIKLDAAPNNATGAK